VVPLARAAAVPALLAFALPAVLLRAPAFEFSCFCLCSLLACAWAEALVFTEAPPACVFWLALALAPTWLGVTEAFPEADPLAVCADDAKLSKPVIATNIQKLFIS
jgi:hypothetical protein